MESSINGKSDRDMGYSLSTGSTGQKPIGKKWGIGMGCGGNAKNRIKLIRTVLLGYNMKNQLSTTNDLRHIRLAVIK